MLSNNQYGFQKGRSTTMALMHVFNEISICLDIKKSTIEISVDFKKVFNAIGHKIL